VHLSESSVCCDYLEEAYPVTPLYPANSIARAQVRQIMKISELYLELAARRLIPFIFTKTDVPAPLADDVRSTLERGVGALNRLCAFDPYVTGAELTMADIYLRYVMNVVDMAGAAKLDWDIGADINGLKDWQALMADSEISQQVDADREANRDEFFAYVQKRMAG
ncbi:MAG: glutathione S-transferase family protein, partial [Pseudomonadales bacterium]|nr:glutathione S-transferase family protein [Pseudomonadales bacterium]